MSAVTQHDPAQTAPPQDSELQSSIVRSLLDELRTQREQVASERKSERRSKMLFQGLIFGLPMLIGLAYFAFFLSRAGFQLGPFRDVVGLVRIEGPIGANESASADSIIPVLERAFQSRNVKAVVLAIDSPGGAPVEAERIYVAIDRLKKKHPKPVVSVIGNIGASAAYMIATHTDKIVAARYSFVGSIGAIMTPWGLDRAIAKFDVEQRVYASGPLKEFLNPFSPVTPAIDQKAHRLVNQMAAAFYDDVKARRGQFLKPGVAFDTGEVWPGPEAKELGLVDAVGTLDEYVAANFTAAAYDFGPSQSQGINFLSHALQDTVVGTLQRLSVSMPSLR